MKIYIKIVKDAIEEYEKISKSTVSEEGYGIEEKTALIWDTLTDILQGNIEDEVYNNLVKSWKEVLEKVYNNKNICIC